MGTPATYALLLTVICSQLTWQCQAQVYSGFMSPNLPTVQLYGQPRVVARRILRGNTNDYFDQVQQHVVATEPYHEARVNVIGANPSQPFYSMPNQPWGIPVVVYRRVLRPAKLYFTGKPVFTDQWLGHDDENERKVIEFSLANRRDLIRLLPLVMQSELPMTF